MIIGGFVNVNVFWFLSSSDDSELNIFRLTFDLFCNVSWHVIVKIIDSLIDNGKYFFFPPSLVDVQTVNSYLKRPFNFKFGAFFRIKMFLWHLFVGVGGTLANTERCLEEIYECKSTHHPFVTNWDSRLAGLVLFGSFSDRDPISAVERRALVLAGLAGVAAAHKVAASVLFDVPRRRHR